MPNDFSFDRAVPVYDRTRAQPAEAQKAIAESIIQEARITPDSRILEVGIGTGRIALPLAERGYPVLGVDLSAGMLDVARSKTAGRERPFALAQANAVSLPFASYTFDLVYAVNVYHLVAEWRQALREARRVCKPRGTLMCSYHPPNPESPVRLIQSKLVALAREYGVDARLPGGRPDDIADELSLWGNVRIVQVTRWAESRLLSNTLDNIAQQIPSFTWSIPAEVMAKIAPRLRDWAENKFGDLERAEPADQPFSWIVMRL